MTLAIAPYQADPEVATAEVEIRTIADAARELEIVDELTNARGVELWSQAHGAVAKVDALRKRFTDPLNALVKDHNAFFKTMAAPAAEADAILKEKTSIWRRKVKAAAEAEQERLRKLAEARAERANERAEEKGLPAPAPMPFMPTVAAPPKSIQVGAVKATYVKHRHFEVVDETKVPRQFWAIDLVKLGGTVRAGMDEIPGVRIWETEELADR